MRQFRLSISYCRGDLSPCPGFKESRIGRISADMNFALGTDSERSPFSVVGDENIGVVAENFRTKVQRAIAECDMAVFFSKKYCESRECEVELELLSGCDKHFLVVATEPILGSFISRSLGRHFGALTHAPYVKFWDSDTRTEKFLESDSPTITLFGDPMSELDTETGPKYSDAIRRLTSALVQRAREQREAGSATRA